MDDIKRLFIHLVDLVKFAGRRENDKKLRNEDIAAAMGISREYLSTLTGTNGKVLQEHVDRLRNAFPSIIKDEDLTISNIPQSGTFNESRPEPYLIRRRNTKNIPSKPYMVPLVPIKAQAGYVRAVDQEAFIDTLEQYALPPGVNPQGAVWRYWEVEGESMEPAFHTGDVILTSQVHPYDWENLRNFYLYVIVTRDTDNPNTTARVLFKRVYCKNNLEWVLLSENEDDYPQQLLPVEYIKEVWVYRRSIVNKAPPTRVFEIKV
jgi:phage repressor protein C with HTH and peptisase S24 domain